LWERALEELRTAGSDKAFTVNSSLSAVPVYEAFGFVPAGSIQRMHGISFLPMRCSAPTAGSGQQCEPLNSKTR
jgi:predicted GNAT family N-acyltransferase